ncbi:MAG: ORF6N domain-containing protein [Pseudomonadota bacterium]
MQHKSKDLIPEKRILKTILVIRGQKVILDSDLAALYGVETKRLNEQVRRNIDKFPEDFMFQLTKEEFENLKSQIATSSSG